jgi:hypothetical protein
VRRSRIALVSARAARALDDDLPPLLAALRDIGVETCVEDWDDGGVDWRGFDIAVLRSTWDYAERLPEFLAWVDRVATCTRLLNPSAVVRWNTDKHYLADLARSGIAVVPSRFVEPGEDAATALDAFLADPAAGAGCREFVAKPSFGAGSRDARRHARAQRGAAIGHMGELLAAQRSVLLQPYLERVDTAGETALLHFDGVFSHAIRKGPLLRPGSGATTALFAAEDITPRTAAPDEIELARRALAAVPDLGRGGTPLAYARVDLIRDDAGAPCVLELELVEPSVFLAHADGATTRFAQVLAGRLSGLSKN